MRVNAYLEVSPDQDGGLVTRCSRCGSALGPARESYKKFSRVARLPLTVLGPNYAPRPSGENRFELREYYCPTCLVVLDTDVALKGDPEVHDVALETEPTEGG